MSQKNIHQLKPFASVLIIISTLFAIVFFQMEERRLGYGVLKLTREYKRSQEERRTREVQLAKVTRPQLLDQLAKTKFTLKKIESDQIVLLSDVKLEPEKESSTHLFDFIQRNKKQEAVKAKPVLAAKDDSKRGL